MDLQLLEKICQQCHLGALQCQPLKLKGGFLHKMYSLFTTKGRYAVKLLDPYIMKRETAKENYRIAEKLELMLEEKKIPIIPALVFENKKMQNIEGQFFYLYEWYDGKALRDEEIKEIHHLLVENRSLLYESQNNGNVAIKKLPPVVSVCHNDMDSKNVLWLGTDCRIIDLECLDYASPCLELYELALCWSGYENCQIDYDLFRCFLLSYAEAGGCLPTDWESIYWCNNGRLEWLEYNLKRSLGIECSAEEIEMGISQVKETIAHVIYYHNAKNDIFRNCMGTT